MKHLHLSTSVLLLSFTLPVSSLYANEKHHEHKHVASENSTETHTQEGELKQHGAHEHGSAILSIAAGENGVEVMLASPAANLVGFEHAANSAEDKKTLADVKAKLEAGENLFNINKDAECTLKETKVVSVLLDHDEAHSDGEKHDEHEHAKGEKHDEHHHDHEKEGKHDEHDEHEHEHVHQEGETHNDMDVTWLFTCAKPSKVKDLTVKLFSAFPDGFQKVKAEWVTATGASAQEIKEDTTLKLK